MQNKEEILLRPARPSDLPRLRELYIEMIAYHFERDARYADAVTANREAANFFQEWLRSSNARLAVAETTGAVVGFGLITLQKPHLALASVSTARIDLLAVDAQFRRSGIGTRLVESLLDWAKGQGAARVFVSHATQNPAASAFWATFGFAEFALVFSLDIR